VGFVYVGLVNNNSHWMSIVPAPGTSHLTGEDPEAHGV